jgi:dGTPase
MTLSAKAPFACRPEASRGRLVPEPESGLRSPFQRDRDRIVHSTAFRRLMYKTQVFVNHEGDHFRTRLTHSLEVGQIARTVARALLLDEDLAEAVALAHDLGHSPFGHAGESALDSCLSAFGGFDHNAQTLRVLTRLERRYAAFDGLNLTFETLEGVVKHNGPLAAPLPPAIAAYDARHDLALDRQPSAEAQLAALADDIAYTNHDLDDGLRAGLFEPGDLRRLPLIGPIVEEVSAAHPGLERPRLIHECIRRLIDRMVVDLLEETRRRVRAAAPESVDAVRDRGEPLVAFSAGLREGRQELRRFLHERMYRHYKVNRMARKARRVVSELFRTLHAEPECLPDDWRARAGAPGSQRTAGVVRDYIAGMTDRFALDEHERLLTFSGRSA